MKHAEVKSLYDAYGRKPFKAFQAYKYIKNPFHDLDKESLYVLWSKGWIVKTDGSEIKKPDKYYPPIIKNSDEFRLTGKAISDLIELWSIDEILTDEDYMDISKMLLTSE